MSKMKRVRIIVSGLVQGVFFRAHTEEWATQLGLKGFVRNLPNGDVEIIAEGEEGKLKELLERVKVGPPAAVVKDVKIEWQKAKNEFKDFRIRYF
ncbi:MAG: acylphosphatase [Candidatus Iainarchaeum archaeon]|uniref:Acylphosphatase n=1 Tax=Candidatus Iainarchaeum sp. TaxID=3101447 RepID=A0A497JKM2_9ARCH|nr:MAG: acylphosphatase [Candidatus Diapherotrites archaeon]